MQGGERVEQLFDGVRYGELLERVVHRARQGVQRVALEVPDQKCGSPKLLCLDMNKWIDLARAHYGRPNGADFADSLHAIRRGIAQQRLVVAIDGANALELMEVRNERRRRELARFMVELSGNHCLRHEHAVTTLELARAAVTVFEGRTWREAFRAQLVRYGVSHAITGYPIKVASGNPLGDRLVTEAMTEPEVAVEALVSNLDDRTAQDFRAGDAQVAAVTDRVRKAEGDVPVAIRRRREFRSVLTGPGFRGLLRHATAETDTSEAHLLAWLDSDDNLDQFMAAVPGLNVEATLMLERDRNQDHATRRNDARDFAFLRVAVPYANVVVTERSWSHIIRASGLDATYETVALSDLRDLPDVLAHLGCG